MDYDVLNMFLEVWTIVGSLSVLAAFSFIGWFFNKVVQEIIDYFRKKKLDKANSTEYNNK